MEFSANVAMVKLCRLQDDAEGGHRINLLNVEIAAIRIDQNICHSCKDECVNWCLQL